MEDKSDTGQPSITAISLGQNVLQKSMLESESGNDIDESSSGELNETLKSVRSLPATICSSIGSKDETVCTNVRESSNIHKETLDIISNYLKNYEPRDSLDEDELIENIDKINRVQEQRRLQKRRRIALSSDEEEIEDFWKNSVLIDTFSSPDCENFRRSLFDVDIFNEIVLAISKESEYNSKKESSHDRLPIKVLNEIKSKRGVTKNSSDSMTSLCPETLNEIKKCFGIEVNKPRKKRRGRPPTVKNGSSSPSRTDEILRKNKDTFYSDSCFINPDSPKLSDQNSSINGRRLTRRMARDTRKKIREEREDEKSQGIDILISVMLDLDKREATSESMNQLSISKLGSEDIISKPIKMKESIILSQNESIFKKISNKKEVTSPTRKGHPRSKVEKTHTNKGSQLTSKNGSQKRLPRKLISNNDREVENKQDKNSISKHILRKESRNTQCSLLLENNSASPSGHQTPKSSSPQSNTRQIYSTLAQVTSKRKRSLIGELYVSEMTQTKTVRVKKIIVNGKTFRGSYNKSTSRKILSYSEKETGTHRNIEESNKNTSVKDDTNKYVIRMEKKHELSSDCHVTVKGESNKHSDDSENKKHNIISLGLLDWHRRQQGKLQTNAEKACLASNSNVFKHIMPAHNILPHGAGIALPPWEEVASYMEIPKKSSTLQPRRRRHSDITYSCWCSRLINCLQGSGRSMARYEFFYSDIDRAWFNVNPFRVDLVMLGIPPNAKLTRSEWSLIRRHIKTRPRRFSRHFIESQLEKLSAYRKAVREIQENPNQNNHSEFPYEVPTHVKVGATVTALSKKAKILHRGIVLTHDIKSNSYLVQFERKELGWESCPDIEVASHGVPEIIKPGSNISLDGTYLGINSDPDATPGTSLYGTTYGPLVVDYSRQNEKYFANKLIKSPSEDDTMNQKVLSRLSSSRSSERKLQKDTNREDYMNFVQQHETSNFEGTDDSSLMKQVAERESLVKLLGTLEMVTLRKKMLLETIESFHLIIKEFVNASGCDAKDFLMHDSNKSFTQHYSWLIANLHLNEERLESTTSYLQIMYGKLYTGRTTFYENLMQQTFTSCANKNESQKRDPITFNTNLSGSWIHSLSSGSESISDMLCFHFIQGENKSKQWDFITRKNLNFRWNRFEAAAKLLITCALTETCVEHLTKKYENNELNELFPLGSNALNIVLNSSIEQLKPKSLGKNQSLELTDAEIHRHNAYKSLVDAVAWLHAEYLESLNTTST